MNIGASLILIFPCINGICFQDDLILMSLNSQENDKGIMQAMEV